MTTDVVVANGVVNGVNGTTTPTSTSKPVIKTEVTRVEANGIEPVTNGESTVSDSEKVTNGETAVNGVEKTANDESTVKPEDQILDVKKVDTSVFLESMALALADKVKEKLEEKLEEEKKKLEEEKEKEKEDEEKKEEADEEKKEGEEETKKKVKVEDMTKEVCRIDGVCSTWIPKNFHSMLTNICRFTRRVSENMSHGMHLGQPMRMTKVKAAMSMTSGSLSSAEYSAGTVRLTE